MVVVKTSGIKFGAHTQRTVNTVAYGSCRIWVWIENLFAVLKSCSFLIVTSQQAVSHHPMMMVVDVLMMQDEIQHDAYKKTTNG